MFGLAGLASEMEHHTGDIRDLKQLRDTVRTFRPDFIFHLAAQAIVSTSYKDPLDTITSNVTGTANVLEVAREIDWPCTAVVITSDKCYDNVEWVWGYRETDAVGGKDIYSGSKGAAELIFRSYYHSFFHGKDHPVRLATARAGNVIGGGDWAADRIVADCIRAWGDKRTVEIRSPAATRPWQHVLEPLSGYLTLAAKLADSDTHDGQSYNFGPRAEQNRTVVDLIGDLGSIWGLQSETEAYTVTGDIPFHEASLLKLNCDKALLHLNWEANLRYDECVDITGSWYRQVLKEGSNALAVTLEQIASFEALARDRGRGWTVAG
ncbi:CDP-glucose 4,6-dehydratase [Agrobacterium rosae]